MSGENFALCGQSARGMCCNRPLRLCEFGPRSSRHAFGSAPRSAETPPSGSPRGQPPSAARYATDCTIASGRRESLRRNCRAVQVCRGPEEFEGLNKLSSISVGGTVSSRSGRHERGRANGRLRTGPAYRPLQPCCFVALRGSTRPVLGPASRRGTPERAARPQSASGWRPREPRAPCPITRRSSCARQRRRARSEFRRARNRATAGFRPP